MSFWSIYDLLTLLQFLKVPMISEIKKIFGLKVAVAIVKIENFSKQPKTDQVVPQTPVS